MLRYSQSLRRDRERLGAPAQKADFVALRACGQVTQQHQIRGNGTRHGGEGAAEGGGNRSRDARAMVSADDIIPSCIQARFMTSQAPFSHSNAAAPTTRTSANSPHLP
jgi:hypothetical protein